MKESTVVLLHGAGAGAWVWERVEPLIAASSVSLDVPSRSRDATPTNCAKKIVEALDDRGIDRVVLVMHSLAGVLAGALADRLADRLDGCVYVSAVVPAKGSTFAKAIGFPGRLLLPLLFRLRPGGLLPSEAMIRKELCTDLKENDCRLVIERYEAEFPGLYLSRVAGPPDRRSEYVKLLQDSSVTPVQQSRIIDRLDDPEVFEIESGHLVMLSHPEKLAESINRFIRSA